MAKKQSRESRRAAERRRAEEAAALRAAEERARRRRTVILSVIGAVVLAGLIGGGLAVRAALDNPPPPATAPKGADGYAVPSGDPDAPVTVTIYEDFLCPFCGDFESLASQWLPEYVDAGDVRVRYAVVAILNGGDDYSARSANAYAAVLDSSGPAAAQEFHDLLYANQPEEGGDGLPDEELLDLAKEAGAERAAVADALAEGTFEQWVENATDAMGDEDVEGTPTVFVDGELVDGYETMAELAKVVQDDIDAQL